MGPPVVVTDSGLAPAGERVLPLGPPRQAFRQFFRWDSRLLEVGTPMMGS
jgi:hypothetical protein